LLVIIYNYTNEEFVKILKNYLIQGGVPAYIRKCFTFRFFMTIYFWVTVK